MQWLNEPKKWTAQGNGLSARSDAKTDFWRKTHDGKQYASAVVTRDCSDWSITPVSNPRAVWMQCARHATTLTVCYSLDGVEYNMIRQSYLPVQSVQQVGMMLAAPQGDGFDVLFEDFLLKPQ